MKKSIGLLLMTFSLSAFAGKDNCQIEVVYNTFHNPSIITKQVNRALEKRNFVLTTRDFATRTLVINERSTDKRTVETSLSLNDLKNNISTVNSSAVSTYGMLGSAEKAFERSTEDALDSLVDSIEKCHKQK